MSTLKIWEMPRHTAGLPFVKLGIPTYQTVTFTGTAGASAAFADSTGLVSISADAACAVRVAADPTAIVTDYPVAANTLTSFLVSPGQKISVIAT